MGKPPPDDAPNCIHWSVATFYQEGRRTVRTLLHLPAKLTLPALMQKLDQFVRIALILLSGAGRVVAG